MENNIPIDKGAYAHLSFGGKALNDYKKIKGLIEHCKYLGMHIVLTQGSFDMIHVGHGRYLKEAKKHGDLLVVGVDSDKKIKKRKGPERPVVPQEERIEMLTHLRYVDLVFLKELNDPKWSLIKAICPDVLIATKETYNNKQLKELKKYCGKVFVLEPMATTTTSAKIRRLQISTAKKLGQALTPKILKTIQDTLDEMGG
ncbi:MAG: hypothetical protein A2431_01665 [Candidatus Zambryskibacteria bacterium RIFOXYC1_FULL_39_10]|uniref:Cytidyltransferase-like domain-containing protein n=1 Tax=Candidatus Zambryskibacteria bacterium RIFOXYC1_FULL_39_10 TaxID=1802779 RepID=A0A1G2V428_9BACT|nr:MAG: hypothetical protein A2605_03065 [Candidatus Zambryskibacteria bacterium RIFOXYD1_FULL_39_35]OHB16386.1 MAG: hypothetical protein A2431_01665 [Candidatus Zambryskibacteria bacterium RIFOXYC1_FULL_39_10]